MRALDLTRCIEFALTRAYARADNKRVRAHVARRRCQGVDVRTHNSEVPMLIRIRKQGCMHCIDEYVNPQGNTITWGAVFESHAHAVEYVEAEFDGMLAEVRDENTDNPLIRLSKAPILDENTDNPLTKIYKLIKNQAKMR